MTYRTGELDQRITFQKRQTVSDGMGGSVVSWVDISPTPTVWAHVRAKTGREVTQYDRVNAESGYLFVIRNRSDLDESLRIVWDGQPFNILTIRRTKGRSLYLELDGEYGVSQ